MKRALFNERGSTILEAAVVFPIIFICVIGIVNISSQMFFEAVEEIKKRFITEWKIERETEWIRNGELLDAQIQR